MWSLPDRVVPVDSDRSVVRDANIFDNNNDDAIAVTWCDPCFNDNDDRHRRYWPSFLVDTGAAFIRNNGTVALSYASLCRILAEVSSSSSLFGAPKEKEKGNVDVVVVSIPEGPLSVVSVASVLRAKGAALLPLDPDKSPERTASMLRDARQTSILCAGEGVAERTKGVVAESSVQRSDDDDNDDDDLSITVVRFDEVVKEACERWSSSSSTPPRPSLGLPTAFSPTMTIPSPTSCTRPTRRASPRVASRRGPLCRATFLPRTRRTASTARP